MMRRIIGLMGRMRRMRPMGPMGPMGRMGLMGLMSLMGLMGCSSEQDGVEPIVERGTAICFMGQENEEQAMSRGNEANKANEANEAYGGTRGTPLNEAGITIFRVWGFKNMSESGGDYGGEQTVFPGYSVKWTANSANTTTSNSHDWEYVNQQTGNAPEQTIKYWDWSAKAYRFFGGARGNGANEPNGAYGTYGANGAYRAYKMTIDVDVTSRQSIGSMPYYSQLWFSTGNITDYPTREFGKPVELVFMKPYSKVRFMYTYVFPRENTMLESQVFKPTADYDAVTPTGIARKGTVIVNYPLTGTETKEWYDITPNYSSGKVDAFFEDYDPSDPTKEYTDAIDGWHIVSPNTSQGSYKLTVTINRVEKTCTVPAEYMQWLPEWLRSLL